MENALQTSANTDTILQLVSFTIGSEEFGVDILKVQEINRMTTITRVPNAPPYVEGVINLRGKIIPIIDLRKRLNAVAADHDKNTRIIVVELGGKVLGFIVDSVSEVRRIPSSITERPPAMLAGIRGDYITSIAKLDDRLLILLDLEKILSSDEQEELAAAL